METNTTQSISQYLTFTLDQELFALGISRVREVLEFKSLTRVPGVPDFMRGVINLRGNTVPVVDIRMKLGLGMTDMTMGTCVVISDVFVEGERTVLGVLVDSLQEVIDLDGNHLEPPPRLGHRIHSSAVRGMGKRDERFVMVLDLDLIFAIEEIRASDIAAPVGEGDAAVASAPPLTA